MGSLKSSKDKCKEIQLPSTCEENALCNSTGWGLMSWGAALQERTWGVGEQQVGHEPVVCPGSKGGQEHPGLYHQERSQSVRESECLFLLSHMENSMSSFESLNARKTSTNCCEFSGGHCAGPREAAALAL